MKIACLISEYLPSIGGAQVCIHNIAVELKKKNDHMVVITTTPEYIAQNYGYEVVRISKWFLKFLKVPLLGKVLLWNCIGKLQRKYRFDIWHVTVGYPLGAYAVPFFKRKKIPCVLRCTGEDIQIHKGLSYGYRLAPAVDRIVRKTYPLYDRLVALTESVKTEYKELGIPDDRICIIPNGVSLRLFSRKENRDEIKKRLGLYGKTVLLTVGRNHPKKGYDLIPDILSKISDDDNDILWIVIGKGCSGINTSGLSEEMGKKLILIEEIEAGAESTYAEIPSHKLIEYYLAADLFVFPSYIETFGMVLVEANAAGLPVVTSDAPGCRDVIKDGYNGLLAEIGNNKIFAEKISHILTDKELYQQLCLNIADNVKQYDWELISESYRKLYEDTVAECKKQRRG